MRVVTTILHSSKQIIKLAVVGDGAVGKTSFIRAKQEKTFLRDSKLTVGVDIACIPFEYHKLEGEGKSQFLAVDVGGQERFHFMHDCYIRGIKAAAIMYDLSRYLTFLNIPKWYELITKENPNCPIFFIGTKCDLVDAAKLEFFKMEFAEMKAKYFNESRIFGHNFISSKDFVGIEECFENCEKFIKQNVEEVLIIC